MSVPGGLTGREEPAGRPSARTLVIIPTYDEAENLRPIVSRTLAATDDSVHVLVVDDNSPDGTGRIAEDLATETDRVHVLHRTVKDGLGGAYLTGFAWGLEHGYTKLVEMDADGSHHPEYLPRMLELADTNDLVLGSRYLRGITVSSTMGPGFRIDTQRAQAMAERGGGA